jgi:hypothetical protein
MSEFVFGRLDAEGRVEEESEVVVTRDPTVRRFDPGFEMRIGLPPSGNWTHVCQLDPADPRKRAWKPWPSTRPAGDGASTP